MSAVDIVKEVITQIKDSVANSVELQMKLAEVCGIIIDVQERNLKLQEENDTLHKRLDTIDDLEIHEGYIIRRSDSEDIKYCPTCWGEREKLIQMSNYHTGTWQCQKCNTMYSEKTRNIKETIEFEPY